MASMGRYAEEAPMEGRIVHHFFADALKSLPYSPGVCAESFSFFNTCSMSFSDSETCIWLLVSHSILHSLLVFLWFCFCIFLCLYFLYCALSLCPWFACLRKYTPDPAWICRRWVEASRDMLWDGEHNVQLKTMDTMRIAFFFSIRKKKKGRGGGIGCLLI